jgi:hypothetical protein
LSIGISNSGFFPAIASTANDDSAVAFDALQRSGRNASAGSPPAQNRGSLLSVCAARFAGSFKPVLQATITLQRAGIYIP